MAANNGAAAYSTPRDIKKIQQIQALLAQLPPDQAALLHEEMQDRSQPDDLFLLLSAFGLGDYYAKLLDGGINTCERLADSGLTRQQLIEMLQDPSTSDLSMASAVADEIMAAARHLISGVAPGKLIGGGNFSKVYKGIWLGRNVAMKCLKKHDFGALLREHKMMSILNHPNIAYSYGIALSEGNQYLVMEYCDGPLWRKCYSVTIPTKIQFAVEITAAMTYLEARHVAHRDLALRNCLFRETEPGRFTVKVTDVGLSRFSAEGYVGRSAFKIEDAAPEVIWDSGVCSTASDVWSFGVLLWYMFSPEGSVAYADVFAHVRVDETTLSANDSTAQLRLEEAKSAALHNFLCTERKTLEFLPGCPAEITECAKLCFNLVPERRPTFASLYDMMLQALQRYSS